jgi:carbonic anhydrase
MANPISPHHHHHKSNLTNLSEKLNTIIQQDSYPDIPTPKTSTDAWVRLIEGNKRFLSGDLVNFMKQLAGEVNPKFRQQLVSAQHPFVTIVTCSDSRVSPEILFDEGLGQLFVVRIAGNRLGDIDLGSVEYGTAHLKTPLLVVMGHDCCGAVTAAFEEGQAEGHIQAIIRKIHPIAKEVKKEMDFATRKDACIALAVQRNVIAAKHDILSSSLIKNLVNDGKLKVITAIYHFSGEVVLIE